MGAVDTLAAWGILRPAEVMELATAARLEVAVAATLLEKESYGGRNVWGADAVDTGGTYAKGAEVTREAYLAYRARRAELGAQGVGPCQLTWPGYQDQADALGGCWDWRINITVGFRTLAGLIRSHGLRDGFRGYNGSGPAAERYADEAMAKLAKWRDRVGAAVVPSPTPRPPTTPVEDDMPTPAQMWDHEIDDPWDGSRKPARVLVGWAATHAAHARGQAEAAARAAAAAQGEVAGLRAAVEQLAAGKGLDPAAIRDAAREGAAAALAEIEVSVHTTQRTTDREG